MDRNKRRAQEQLREAFATQDQVDRDRAAYLRREDAIDPERFKVLCSFAAFSCADAGGAPDGFLASVTRHGRHILLFNDPAAAATFRGIEVTTAPEGLWPSDGRRLPSRFKMGADYTPRSLPANWFTATPTEQ